jgi:branched-chain amino acid transport system substrate-binding protein
MKRFRQINRKWLSLVPIGMTASLLALTAACGSSPASGTVSGKGGIIKIGILASESGSGSVIGIDQLHGAQIAVNQINASGGIAALGGAKLRLEAVDVGSTSAAQAIAGANQLVSEQPVAIVGNNASTLEEPASTVTEKAGIPTCTGALADTLTTRGYKYIFQLPPQATTLASNAVSEFLQFLQADYPNVTKIGVLYDTNPAEAGTGEAFAKAIESTQSRVKVVLNDEFPVGLTNAGPVAAKIQSSGAQMLVPGASLPSELEEIVASLDSLGIKNIPMFNAGGGIATTDAYYLSLGQEADGQYVLPNWGFDTNESPAQNQILATLDKTYTQDYGRTFIGQFPAEGYVCVQLFAAAMENSHSDSPSAIRDALVNHTFTSGPASIWPPGKISFNSAGLDTDAISLIAEWCDEKLEVIGPPQYKSTSLGNAGTCG